MNRRSQPLHRRKRKAESPSSEAGSELGGLAEKRGKQDEVEGEILVQGGPDKGCPYVGHTAIVSM